VKENDIVFVGGGRSKEFLTECNPEIKVSYTLVSHNSDELIDESYVPLLTPNIQRWYSYNVEVQDERIVPIPLGIENKHYYVTGDTDTITRVRKKNYPKDNVIFYGYSISTNTEARQHAQESIVNHELARPLTVWQEFALYLPEVARCKFVQSPRGSSIEGHRTWEAMYLGAVPIVLSNVMHDYFKSLGAPMLVLQSWDELEEITLKTIDKMYQSTLREADTKVLNMQYWEDKIRQAAR